MKSNPLEILAGIAGEVVKSYNSDMPKEWKGMF